MPKKSLRGCGTLTIKDTPGKEDYTYDSKEIIKKIDELKEAILNSKLKQDSYNIYVRKVNKEIPKELSKDITKLRRKNKKGEILEENEIKKLKEYYTITKGRKAQDILSKRNAIENIIPHQQRKKLLNKVKEIIKIYIEGQRELTQEEKDILKEFKKQYPNNKELDDNLYNSMINNKHLIKEPKKEPKEELKEERFESLLGFGKHLIPEGDQMLKEETKQKNKQSKQKSKISKLDLTKIKTKDEFYKKSLSSRPETYKEYKKSIEHLKKIPAVKPIINKYNNKEKITEEDYKNLVIYKDMMKKNPKLKQTIDKINEIINNKFEKKDEPTEEKIEIKTEKHPTKEERFETLLGFKKHLIPEGDQMLEEEIKINKLVYPKQEEIKIKKRPKKRKIDNSEISNKIPQEKPPEKKLVKIKRGRPNGSKNKPEKQTTKKKNVNDGYVADGDGIKKMNSIQLELIKALRGLN